jgi:predicted transcriptional regulator
VVRKTKKPGDRLLTEVELELMTIIWSQGKTTVKDVADAMPKTRPLAYNSVGTVMKILEQKGFLKCEKHFHAHTFSPLVAKAAYEESCLDHVVDNVFDGEPVALVQRLLTAKRLSAAEIRAIEATLEALAPKARQASKKGLP